MTSRFIISMTLAAFLVIALSMVLLQKSASSEYTNNVSTFSSLMPSPTKYYAAK